MTADICEQVCNRNCLIIDIHKYLPCNRQHEKRKIIDPCSLERFQTADSEGSDTLLKSYVNMFSLMTIKMLHGAQLMESSVGSCNFVTEV